MKISKDKIYVVVPAYNEAKVIAEVIQEIKDAGFDKIIVVDDGSDDYTRREAEKAGAIALRLSINRGKGAAVKTGIEAAKILQAELVITMDADGQHNPQDGWKMVKLIREQEYDVVLGTRLRNAEKMPKIKIFYNYIGNFLTWLFYGLWVSDSQSGFRAFSRRAIQLIDTKGDRYEYDSEVIREIKKHQLKYTEVPIEVRYTEYSMGKAEKQGFKNGVKTVIKMLISN